MSNEVNVSFKIAQNTAELDFGANYIKGDDGVSPIVEVSKAGKVTTIKIIDAEGEKTAEINDGEDGKDAVSPAATVSKSGKTSTFTVTDANGTTEVEIKDGEDGYTPVKGTDYMTASDINDMVDKTVEGIRPTLDTVLYVDNEGYICLGMEG